MTVKLPRLCSVLCVVNRCVNNPVLCTLLSSLWKNIKYRTSFVRRIKSKKILWNVCIYPTECIHSMGVVHSNVHSNPTEEKETRTVPSSCPYYYDHHDIILVSEPMPPHNNNIIIIIVSCFCFARHFS